MIQTDMTIENLFLLEPELKKLAEDIQRFEYSGEIVCVDHAWYGCRGKGPRFKSRMLHLVGRMAENPALQTDEAYNLTCNFFYNLLSHGPADIHAMKQGVYG